MYQRTLLLTAQREPPLTATPLLDEELTPLFGWIVPDELDVEVESLVLLVEVEALEAEADVPGMVAALTAAKTPTRATAASDAPTVIR